MNLKAGKISAVRNLYLERLYWLNESKPYRSVNGLFNGSIKTVRDNGLLVIKNNNGGELEFNFKEIEFLNGSGGDSPS